MGCLVFFFSSFVENIISSELQYSFRVSCEKQREGNSYILEEGIVGYSHLIIQKKKHFSEQGQKCNFTAVIGSIGILVFKTKSPLLLLGVFRGHPDSITHLFGQK